MGRRLAGGALVALGLLTASLAWSGFSLTRTILDPGRSRAVADDLYRDPIIRSQLKSSMAAAVTAALPEGVPVTRQEVADAAERALDDPAVEQLLIGGLVQAHQRFLGADPNPDQNIVIDGSVLASSTRSHLVNARPELLGAIPEIPSVAVPLPVDSIPDAGGLRSTLIAGVTVLAAIAAGLGAAAFVVTNNRPQILRRIGYWAIGAAAFWLLMGALLPVLAHLLLPDQAAIIGGIWGVAAKGMWGPSMVAGGAGVAALVLSLIWGLAAPKGHPRASRPGRVRSAPLMAAAPVSAPAPYPAPVAYAPRPGREAYAASPVVTPPQGVPTVSTPAPPPAAPPPAPAAPAWVEGHGYVEGAEGF